jgi:hypothetical protein
MNMQTNTWKNPIAPLTIIIKKKLSDSVNAYRDIAFRINASMSVGLIQCPYENNPVAAIDPKINPTKTIEPRSPKPRLPTSNFSFIALKHPGSDPWSTFIIMFVRKSKLKTE